jgi:ComF family protein
VGPGLVDGAMGMIGRLVGLVIPESCQLCGRPRPGQSLCGGCRADLPWIRVACPVCACPLPEAAVCGRCLRRPPPWLAALAPLAWAFPVDRLVGRLKYSGALFHAPLLGALLADAAAGRAVDLVVPMPLHPKRLRQRGYNQALEIARPVARRLGVPLGYDVCRRVRAAPPQAGLPARARRRNVRGAFEAADGMEGLAVAIVDDVLTTGATAAEAARALARAGASRIEIWSVARAGPGRAGPRPGGTCNPAGSPRTPPSRNSGC